MSNAILWENRILREIQIKVDSYKETSSTLYASAKLTLHRKTNDFIHLRNRSVSTKNSEQNDSFFFVK